MTGHRAARAQMYRRRRRTALLLTLLLVLVVAWTWRASRPHEAPAAANTGRAAAGSDGPESPPAASAPTGPADASDSGPQPGPAASAAAAAASAAAAKGTGRLSVVAGASQVYGSGPLRRFLVEVEEGLGSQAGNRAYADFVAATLGDPRSWTSAGSLSLQRVDSGPVDFRVTLASPRVVDAYCAPLDTNGYTSCYDGKGRAMLNVIRWRVGVPWYAADMATYRRYMVNHEVGHALGHHHQFCPAPGALAPTMQQQTLGMQGCRHNAWPYP